MNNLALNYLINGAAVTLVGVNVPLSSIILIENVTAQRELYSIGGPPPINYAQGANTVITFDAVMGTNDKLTIIYNDGISVASLVGGDATGVTMPTGGSGIRGWLSGIFAATGTDATGVTNPTGGAGIRGWLSGIYGSFLTLLTRIPVLGGADPSASLPVTAPRKLSVTGISAAPTTTYANLLDHAGLAGLDVRDYNTALITVISAATTGSYSIKGAFDAAGTIGSNILQAVETNVQTGAGVIAAAIIPTAATRTFRVNLADVNYLFVPLATGVTSGALRVYAVLSQAVVIPTQLTVVQGTAANLQVTPAANSGVNLAQLGGTAPNATVSNGSTNKSLGVYLGGPVSNVDYSAIALTPGASGVQTLVADASGGGASVGYNINLSAFVPGSSGGIIFALQETPDNGVTNYRTLWMCEALTAAGIATIPPVPVNGRRRLVWWTVANVTITSGTITVTAQGLSGETPKQAMYFDRGPATIANTGFTGAAASTLALSTLNVGSTSASAPFLIEGLKAFKITLDVASQSGTTTTAPVLTLQVSDDFVKWSPTPLTLTGPLVAGTVSAFSNSLCGRYARLAVTTAQAGATTYVLGYASIYGTN